MTKFEELLNNSKNQINSLITKDMKSEEIAKISDISKGIDSLLESYNEQVKENQSLKELIVKQVQIQGSKDPDDDDRAGGETKTLDEIIINAGKEIIKERKN